MQPNFFMLAFVRKLPKKFCRTSEEMTCNAALGSAGPNTALSRRSTLRFDIHWVYKWSV